MSYNEIKQHGTSDFPIELYTLEHSHPKYEMAFHYHRELELIRVSKGQLRVWVDNRQLLLNAGDCALVNSESLHGASPRDCHYQCIVFSPLLLSAAGEIGRFFAEGLQDQSLLLPSPLPPCVQKGIHGLFEAMEQYDGDNRLGVYAALFCLFDSIYRQKHYRQKLPLDEGKDPKNLHKLKKALRYMRDHFDASITLEDVAAAAHTSPKYLCAFFKEMTGETPIGYLLTYRIERASRQLLSTDHSITQVAYSCGFNDLSYFIKTFKAFKGVSPTAFRKSAKSLEEL